MMRIILNEIGEAMHHEYQWGDGWGMFNGGGSGGGVTLGCSYSEPVRPHGAGWDYTNFASNLDQHNEGDGWGGLEDYDL